jgi:hypothetical protein
LPHGEQIQESQVQATPGGNIQGFFAKMFRKNVHIQLQHCFDKKKRNFLPKCLEKCAYSATALLCQEKN